MLANQRECEGKRIMLFDDLSRRLQELKDEIRTIQQKNDEYLRDDSCELAGRRAFDNRRLRLEQIKAEIASILGTAQSNLAEK